MMPTWAELIEIAPWFAAGVLILVLLIWAGSKGVPALRKVMHFIDDVAGEPARAGVPARPGLMERMTTIETSLQQVRHEVTPNHGSTMNDALRSVREDVSGIRETVDETSDAVSDLTKWQETHQRVTDQAMAQIEQNTKAIERLNEKE